MDRRNFLMTGTTAAAGLAASSEIFGPIAKADETVQKPILRRKLGKTGEELSIVGFAGIVVMNNSQSFANNIVAEAVDRGINYFDVAPSYGDAQARLGPALEPYRKKVFLACKEGSGGEEGDFTKDSAAKTLDESLRQLRTDHVDLYQFHALSKMSQLEQIFGPNGAMEAFQAARQAGKLRFIGFSAHSVEVAIAAMDRYNFDTILFPINFVLASQAKFGPQVIAHAREKGMGIMAIKGMARTTWPESVRRDHPHEKCWYEPGDFPTRRRLAIAGRCPSPSRQQCRPGMRDTSGWEWTSARTLLRSRIRKSGN